MFMKKKSSIETKDYRNYVATNITIIVIFINNKLPLQNQLSVI